MDDDILMAFADGELSAEQAARVADAVASDPAIAARVDLFRQTRAMVAVTRDAVPAGDDSDLIARIRAAQVAAPPVVAAVETPAPANRNWAPLAAAASLVIAVGLGWWSGFFGGAQPALQPVTPAILAALDSVPSGESAPVEGGEFTAIATFRVADGRVCREYDVTGDNAQVAVACRTDGAWQNLFAAAATESTGYVPASGDIQALDVFLTQIGAGNPLTAEDEAAALK
ncbi:anti-sigma factor [Paracoccus sp. (in: a-proteobacteria)]|uniref:anti-sigma factor family protein n=1 Tax=Paracoccus sp. TaxID=267 RepID=UPI0026DFD7B9|nr:hypothetical protein [Paracoccus sp. (in: a-proteobacteria)]MDO5646609.1 hypothetical protein [Paracoccus sp. (in: a-proteobacteria)]